MLDVEVILVMEDSDGLASLLAGGAIRVIASFGRNGDRAEIDLLRHVDGGVEDVYVRKWVVVQFAWFG